MMSEGPVPDFGPESPSTYPAGPPVNPAPTSGHEPDSGVPFVDQAIAEAQMGATPKAANKIKGGIVGAAMVGLGKIIEPSKVKESVEITAEADAPDDDPLAGLNFGSLPPID